MKFAEQENPGFLSFSRFPYLPRPEQVDAEFLTRPFIRVDQMKRLRICTADYAFVIGSHVHELFRIIAGAEAGRNHAGADRYGLHCLEHEAGLLRSLSPNGEPEFAAVAEQGPERDGVERAVAELGFRCVVVLELQRYADQPAAHFLRQRRGGDRQFEEE